MRWYNPGFRAEAKPQIDEEVLSLLDGCPSGELCAEVYGESGASWMRASCRSSSGQGGEEANSE